MISSNSRTIGCGKPRQSVPARLVLLLLPVLGLVSCTTMQERVTQREDKLVAAGFTVRPANTPARQAMLNRLPPHHFVQRVHGNVVTYVYADPLVCDCLYIGSQQAYAQFRRDIEQQKLADEQEMTAAMYSDQSWDWGAWGPWGPEYGYDGFGSEPGW